MGWSHTRLLSQDTLNALCFVLREFLQPRGVISECVPPLGGNGVWEGRGGWLESGPFVFGQLLGVLRLGGLSRFLGGSVVFTFRSSPPLQGSAR